MKMLVLFLIFYSQISFSQVIDRILVIINSEVITESDLRDFQSRMHKQGTIDEALLGKVSPDELKKNRELQIQYLIKEKLIEGEVKRENLTVTMDRVDQEIKEIAKRNGISKQDLLNAIKNQGMNVSEYQSFIKARVEKQSLMETEITSKIRISDEDVMSYYLRNNPKAKSGIYEYKLSHIYFDKKKGGRDAAMKKAKAALGLLQNGTPFEVVAEQNSEDKNFSEGGALGNFKDGEMGAEMDRAVTSLQLNGYTDVVEQKNGFHIFRLINKTVIADPEFQKVKERYRNDLFEQTFQKQLLSWLESKKEESFIRINK